MEINGADLASYDRRFHVAGAAQRNACDPIFMWEIHGLSCLSSADDLNVCRKSWLVILDLKYAGSTDSKSLYVKMVIL